MIASQSNGVSFIHHSLHPCHRVDHFHPDSGLNHVTCFSQWFNSNCEGELTMCLHTQASPLSLLLEPHEHYMNKLGLACRGRKDNVTQPTASQPSNV